MSLNLFLNIRDQCGRKEITIAELERRAGLAENALYKWSCTSPSVDKVKAVADALGVTMDDLVRGD